METAERVSHTNLANNYVFQRSLLAYIEASKLVNGDVLEIGTGGGYGIKYIASKANKFVTIDKFKVDFSNDNEINKLKNVEFIKMVVPPLLNIKDESFDFVISFQVIEHIQNDKEFVKEIYRVLKKDGKFIFTTPNKIMSLTRNPWHVREYSSDELEKLLNISFKNIKKFGVFGNEKIMNYYEKNKKAVHKITRFDIFNLQHRLPRKLLQIPFDILNKFNRKKLLNNNKNLVSNIKMEDYYLNKVGNNCIDLFFIAEK